MTHALEEVLGLRGEVDLQRFAGLRYEASVVRERPVKNVNVNKLRKAVTKSV